MWKRRLYACAVRCTHVSKHVDTACAYRYHHCVSQYRQYRIFGIGIGPSLLLGGYDYSIAYKPGQQRSNADMLSRLPTCDAPSSTPVPPETILVYLKLDSSPVTSTKFGSGLAKVKDVLLSGNRPDDSITPYHKIWSELSVEEGCCSEAAELWFHHRDARW